ncbi:MAG: bifunctional 3-deoxy-7-phosphoheptulonate synthase/chorismate mutase type II [Flavobacteriales bacterium]|nr:bifunctional 3-deoxy-7-phosphoheptulonate synthase/chorismate mutase type II [Flavobacteriales bacterium]HPF89168.1 bifunctional 3-deoxy-7-phosphoheptulonate synthase/chorismate mutase type II [Flavobacteriales bacterium]
MNRPTSSDLHPRPFAAWGLGLERPLVIAGPCSAESEAQVMATARGLAATGLAQVFRAGVWKPRTRPGSFEGVGDVALPWLARVKEETGLRTMVEVATAAHVDAALNGGVDMLWIGARTTPNPFSVQEVADALRGVDIPVFVKNPINPDLQLWIGALERLHRSGLNRLAAIHRGFSWFERTPFRNSPMWEFPIRLKAAFPDLELIGDPSHISGNRTLLAGVAQQALDLGFSGLMIEVHADPGQALSDADQQLRPAEFEGLVRSLIFRQAEPTPGMRDRLDELRELIDQLDEEIAQKMGARMELAARIGEHKRAHQVAIIQPERWEWIMERQLQLAPHLGLSEAFIREVMDAVHRESIRKQTTGEDGQEILLPAGSQGSGGEGLDPR